MTVAAVVQCRISYADTSSILYDLSVTNIPTSTAVTLYDWLVGPGIKGQTPFYTLQRSGASNASLWNL